MGFLRWRLLGLPPRCGVEVVLHISSTHYKNIKYAPGGGTNSRVELIALWTLLEEATKKDIRHLQVYGNSKIVIDWEKGIASIQNQFLENIMRDIKLNFRAFGKFVFPLYTKRTQ